MARDLPCQPCAGWTSSTRLALRLLRHLAVRSPSPLGELRGRALGAEARTGLRGDVARGDLLAAVCAGEARVGDLPAGVVAQYDRRPRLADQLEGPADGLGIEGVREIGGTGHGSIIVLGSATEPVL